jgi:hypothetical protein
MKNLQGPRPDHLAVEVRRTTAPCRAAVLLRGKRMSMLDYESNLASTYYMIIIMSVPSVCSYSPPGFHLNPDISRMIVVGVGPGYGSRWFFYDHTTERVNMYVVIGHMYTEVPMMRTKFTKPCFPITQSTCKAMLMKSL